MSKFFLVFAFVLFYIVDAFSAMDTFYVLKVESTPAYILTIKLNRHLNTPRVINRYKIRWR